MAVVVAVGVAEGGIFVVVEVGKGAVLVGVGGSDVFVGGREVIVAVGD